MDNFENFLIETDRLWLRPIESKDAQDIYESFTAKVTTYMYPRPHVNLLETDGFIRHCIMKRRQMRDVVFTIIHKETYEFIGLAGIHQIDTKTPELGIWTKESAFGHKYGREAVTGIVDVFDELYDFDYYLYPVDERNVASRKIAESLGGILKNHKQETNASGDLLEIVEYWIYQNKEDDNDASL